MTRALCAGGLIAVKAPMADLLALADMDGAADALIFNALAQDVALRRDACCANVLHTGLSRAMLADALAQLLIRKRWTGWMLIAGVHPGNRAFADAIRLAAAKFGARIREDKQDLGVRRGHAPVRRRRGSPVHPRPRRRCGRGGR
jgi:ABC transporter substrate binding protein (PQQ-dependent alcohol dehydrogenase system)